MTKIDCPYKDVCCDVNTEKCVSCLNNKKKSYYIPYPYYPYRPSDFYQYPWWTTSDSSDGVTYYVLNSK